MDSSQEYEELRNKTVLGLFLERVGSTLKEVAYRAKKLGIYQERTWFQFMLEKKNCSLGITKKLSINFVMVQKRGRWSVWVRDDERKETRGEEVENNGQDGRDA